MCCLEISFLLDVSSSEPYLVHYKFQQKISKIATIDRYIVLSGILGIKTTVLD